MRYNGRDDRGHSADLPADIQAAIEVQRGDLKDPERRPQGGRGARVGLPPRGLDRDPVFLSEPLRRGSDQRVGHGPRARRLPGAARRSSGVVLTSTSEVYGTAQTVPIDERHPLQGQSPYAATKIGADALGESYHRAFGLPVTILRPFNTFGPRQSARAIIPTIISQALTRPVVRLGRLDPRRDLTYVKDTVAGFVAIAGCDAALGRAVNIGRGEDISIGELVERIGRRLGRTDPRRDRSERAIRPAASEVERLLAGTALAQSSGAGSRATRSTRGSTRRSPGLRERAPVPGGLLCDMSAFANSTFCRLSPFHVQPLSERRMTHRARPIR